jgi:hypothetical protein
VRYQNSTQEFCPEQHFLCKILFDTVSNFIEWKALFSKVPTDHTLSFGSKQPLTTAQVFEVFTSRSRFERFARLAACAAFLACSFLGKTLHDLQHALENTSTANQSDLLCSQFHSQCPDCGKKDSTTDHKNPQTPHDPHNYKICNVLCVAAISIDTITF